MPELKATLEGTYWGPDGCGDIHMTFQDAARGLTELILSPNTAGLHLETKAVPVEESVPAADAAGEVKEDPPVAVPPEDAGLDELRKFCKDNGITVDNRWGFAKLRGAIEEWRA
jgi:hypothetical protein